MPPPPPLPDSFVLLLALLLLLAAVSSFCPPSSMPARVFGTHAGDRIKRARAATRMQQQQQQLPSNPFSNPQDGSRPPPPEAPWFVEGAKFGCTGCGKCCRVKGDVWLSPGEVEGVVRHLRLTVEEMVEAYGEEYHASGWLRLKSRAFPEGGESCIFLDDSNQCSIYEARPLQCRTYPWWPRIMYSRDSWLNESVVPDDIPLGPHWNDIDGGCEGIDHPEAPIVEFGTIRENLLMQMAYNRRLPTHLAP